MGQIAYVKLPKEWELLEDIISEERKEAFAWDATKTYSIEARGTSPAFLCEPEEGEPSKNSGVMLDGGALKTAEYKTGNYLLYAKTDGECWLNIHELEA